MRAGLRAKEPEPPGRVDLVLVLMGAVVAFVVSLVASGILGAVMLRATFSEGLLPLIMTLTTYASVAAGGLYTGYKAETLGWLNGGLAGLAYVLALAIVGALLFPQTVTAAAMVKKALASFAVGAFGGTVGINMQ